MYFYQSAETCEGECLKMNLYLNFVEFGTAIKFLNVFCLRRNCESNGRVYVIQMYFGQFFTFLEHFYFTWPCLRNAFNIKWLVKQLDIKNS